MTRLRSHGWIIVLVAVVALGLAAPAAAAEKTLEIGVLGPLSGGAASYGVELVRAAEIRTDEINKAGGLKVGGDVYKIKLVTYDHKASAADAATAANKLIFQDKVKYIIGNAVGATCNAVQTVSEPQKVLFAFVCWGTNNLGPDTNTAVVKAVKSLGLELVAEETYERGTKDFYPILNKILAKKPDLLDVAASPPGEAGLILKQAHELGFKGAKGWTAGTNPASLVSISGPEAAEHLWSPLNINVKSDFVDAKVRKFGDEYEKRYKEVPGAIAVANYAAFDVITKAMQEAGSVDTDKVLVALTSRGYDTVWGHLAIGAKETYGIDRQFLYPMVISEVRGGKVVDIEQVMPAALKALKK